MKKYINRIIKSVSFIIIMTICFILIDLYVPIKAIIMGNEQSSSEFWSHIKFDYGDWIIIAIFGIFGFIDKKKN
jgi:uncharacterized membrane protein